MEQEDLMPEYYSRMCKICGIDTDDKFCSYECQLEWEEGRADYLIELERDRRMFEDDQRMEML